MQIDKYDVPFIYYGESHGYVVNPTEKFKREYDTELISQKAGIDIYKTVLPDSIPFHMHVSVSLLDEDNYDFRSPFMKCSSPEITSATIPDVPSTEVWATMIMHEYVHGFQFRHTGFMDYFERSSGQMTQDSLKSLYAGYDWYRELADKENEMLLSAIASKSAVETESFVDAFFDYRRQRRTMTKQRLNSDIEATEQLFETMEGSARYVEFKLYDIFSRKQPYGKMLRSDSLYQDYSYFKDFSLDKAQWLYMSGRNYYYATGFNILRLLDKLNIDYKSDLFKESFSVEEILAEGVGNAFRLSHTDSGTDLEYRLGENSLFTYNYATVYPPAGVDTVYKRSGFIHPLNTIGGETLTNLSPSDHYHHYGLWYAWTQTTFRGDTIDFWNLYKKEGTVRFREFTTVSDSGFSAILDHVAYPDSPDEKAAMTENLEIKVVPVVCAVSPGGASGAATEGYFIDYTTTLRCATYHAVTLQAYRYGGLVIRTREDWTPESSTFTSSEGFTRSDADGTDARWAYIQGVVDDGESKENEAGVSGAGSERGSESEERGSGGGEGEKSGGEACVLIMSHPANLNHPEPLRIWDENTNGGIGDMMWNFSPTKNLEYTLLPSEEPKLRYRIFVFDHEITPERVESLWQEFATERGGEGTLR